MLLEYRAQSNQDLKHRPLTVYEMDRKISTRISEYRAQSSDVGQRTDSITLSYLFLLYIDQSQLNQINVVRDGLQFQ